MADCLTCIHQEVCKERMEIFNLPNIACQYEAHELVGEWVENTRYKRKGKKFLDCSRCHYGENGDIICEVSKVPNFCPNCGAKMQANDRQVTGKLDSENEYESKAKELENAIAKCEKAEEEFKKRTCKFKSPTNCDFCAFHSDCEEHWKEGDENG